MAWGVPCTPGDMTPGLEWAYPSGKDGVVSVGRVEREVLGVLVALPVDVV